MSVTLDDIVTALVVAGIGQVTDETADWFIRAGYMQASPDRCICVYETPGAQPETGLAVDYPNFQIKVRGKLDDYRAMRAKEQETYLFLHAGNAPTQFGTDYTYCYAIQSAPLPMGQDENRRPAVVRNYKMMKVRG